MLARRVRAAVLLTYLKTGFDDGPHEPNESTTIGTNDKLLFLQASLYLGILIFFS